MNNEKRFGNTKKKSVINFAKIVKGMAYISMDRSQVKEVMIECQIDGVITRHKPDHDNVAITDTCYNVLVNLGDNLKIYTNTGGELLVTCEKGRVRPEVIK